MSTGLVSVAAGPLRAWTHEVLMRTGVREAAAADSARLLIRTSLRGIDTHGIARLPQYTDEIDRGRCHANATPRMQERSGVIYCDGGGGLGQHIGTLCLRAAIESAKSQAMVGCSMHNCGHLAALGVLALEAAESGFVALLMQRTMPIMAMHGFQGRAIGNNPIAFAMPVPLAPPLVFDMAMSEVARGHLSNSAREGKGEIPHGWALDEFGQETTDVQAALRGSMLPMASHKGMGLAMLVECLAGSLSGSTGHTSGAFLLVLNPSLLMGREAFESGVLEWLEQYRGAAGSAGRYPGQRQAQCERERMTSGIPLGPNLYDQLQRLAVRHALPFPPAL